MKQLDRTYNHPEYVVDFLLIFEDETHREHKIIIEYDGFQEHFKEIDEISEFNYEYYYSDEDVYRQKVLECYGYKFLRINRFNVGKNPITTLDERIANLIKEVPTSSKLLTNIHETKGLPLLLWFSTKLKQETAEEYFKKLGWRYKIITKGRQAFYNKI